jgi:60 kDa SS-A/Ro ribonucleoprotein
VESEFVAKAAVYCREKGFMKDMPALLCAVLSLKDRGLLKAVFSRVINDGRMLRNFVQILRSGVVGRKSLGTLPKRLVQEWLESRSDEALFRASVGQNPSLADVVKMVHPKPANPAREALYGYLTGRGYGADLLPETVRLFEGFKAKQTTQVPDVPFQMLTALELGAREWTAIARQASWQTTRMNLNTFVRHKVFDERGLPDLIAERLRNPEAIRKIRVFPYQLLVAYTMAANGVPQSVREALQDAMEVAIHNVPRLDGKVYVFPDVSSSMTSSVTGYRKGSTSTVRCVDVTALMAAAVLRNNSEAEILPFDDRVHELQLNPRDSIMTNATRLASVGGGGTNSSAPLARLNRLKAKGDLVIYVSDNQSWMDGGAGRGTATMQEWNAFKHRNPEARLVCIDVQPYATTQATEREDILNVGGFSDQVFEVVAEFAAGRLGPDHWIGSIEAVTL